MELVVSWFVKNWEYVLGALFAVHALAKTITVMTPTPTDDKWVAKFYSLLDWFAGNVGYTKDPGSKTVRTADGEFFISDESRKEP